MKYILILATVFGLTGGLSYATAAALGTTILPEPTSLLLVGIALTGVAGILRRSGKRKSQ